MTIQDDKVSLHFSIANIPFGIASSLNHPHLAAATRLQNVVIFLDELFENGYLDGIEGLTKEVLVQSTLNTFAALPLSVRRQVRARLQSLLDPAARTELPESCYCQSFEAKMHLPVSVGDFTDFSCSRDHCSNASEVTTGKRMLPPAFLHLPVGYGGRCSSIVVSGTEIQRPMGQYPSESNPQEILFQPSKQVDYEMEVGAIISKSTRMGERVSIEQADEHIFGLVLINDWSIRDVQWFEMIPIGPLNSKNVGTSMSPWIVTLDALSQFETAPPPRDFPVAPYLDDPKQKSTYAVQLQVEIVADGQSTITGRSRLDSMYWTFRHLVAHQTIGGCNLNTGDILASGTVSGSDADSYGCLMEKSKGGKVPFILADGSERRYLNDGDTVRMTGWGVGAAGVGFGECMGTIMPAQAFRNNQ